MAGSYVEWNFPGHFFGQDMYKTALEELHAGSDELGQIEQANISNRTQVLTGALLSSISYEPSTDPNDSVLVFMYADMGPQEDQYNRVYDIYQEGGADGFGTAGMGLGAGSNNGSGNHEMFGRMFTEDLGAIEQWGNDMLSHATSRLAAGMGVSI